MSTPEPLGGRRHNPNTPEGQIESVGMFARGLGARRIRIAIMVALVVVLIIILVPVIF